MSAGPASEGSWHRVADETEFPPGSLRGALVGGVRLCVGRGSAGLFAVSDTCPHAGGSLSEGMVDGREVICPIHAWGAEPMRGAPSHRERLIGRRNRATCLLCAYC